MWDAHCVCVHALTQVDGWKNWNLNTKLKKVGCLFIHVSEFKGSFVTQQEQKAFTAHGSWY
jgi:hypothetical protein